MEDVFKAIADPSRRRILELVADRERTAGEIAAYFAVTRPAVSQHLSALTEAGLVRERRRGTSRWYGARRQGMVAALLFLQAFWDERLAGAMRAGEGRAGGPPAPTQRLCVTRELPIPSAPEQVWQLLTDGERMTLWMGVAATLEAEPGGTYRVEVVPGEVASGEVVEVDPPHRLVHTWGWEGHARAVVPPGASLVAYDIVDVPTGTLLRLSHRQLPSVWSAGSHARGWAHYLDRLARVAAGGNPGVDPWVSDASRFRAELRP